MSLFFWCETFLDSFKQQSIDNDDKMTYNFSSLWTKKLHSKLLDGGLHKHIGVNRFGAKWISKSDGYSVVSNKCSFKKAIKYVLGNRFF